MDGWLDGWMKKKGGKAEEKATPPFLFLSKGKKK
jgi:hypothetical protein